MSTNGGNQAIDQQPLIPQMSSRQASTNMAESSSSSSPQNTAATTQSKTQSSTSSSSNQSETLKPFKMNTYIQLEIDQSNFNSLPRVCKFLVTKLQLQMDEPQQTTAQSVASGGESALWSSSSMGSVILAVKLQVSKRSLRTLEIPLFAANTITARTPNGGQMAQVELNLNYNITYPHYLKKDTNILYFYLQRRKKYKSKKILGYKTLAFTFIDLANVMQRPFSNNLPLYQSKSNSDMGGSKDTNAQMSSSDSKFKNLDRKVIGYLTVQSLVSVPTELINEDNNMPPGVQNLLNGNQNYRTPASRSKKVSYLNEDYLDELDLLNQICSDNEVDNLPRHAAHHLHHHHHRSKNLIRNGNKNNKENFKLISNLTRQWKDGKLISFLRKKLKNESTQSMIASQYLDVNSSTSNAAAAAMIAAGLENSGAAGAVKEIDGKSKSENEHHTGENQNELESEDAADEEYAEDEDEEDESQDEEEEEEEADLDDYYNVEQISDYYTDSDEEQEEDSYSIVSTPKPRLQPFYSQSCLDVLNTSTNSGVDLVASSISHQSSNDFKLLLIDHTAISNSEQTENDEYFINLITKSLNCVLINNLSEFIQIIDLIVKQKKNVSIKIILFCSENYLNKYLKLYLDLVKLNENFSVLLKHYFIPRRVVLVNNNQNNQVMSLGAGSTSSLLVNYLGRQNQVYQSLFLDDLWAFATAAPISNNLEHSSELLSRLGRYINTPESGFCSLQIGEVMLNDEYNSKFIPFLVDVRIGIVSINEPIGEDQQQQPSGLTASPIVSPPNAAKSSSISSSNSMPQFTQQQQSPTSVCSSQKNRFSPPNSPLPSIASSNTSSSIYSEDSYNLQLDYWSNEAAAQSSNTLNTSSSTAASAGATSNPKGLDSNNSSKVNQKSSLKAFFKNVHVYREELIKPKTSELDHNLCIKYILKEKKQKIMRLGKKAKDLEFKKETVDGVTRLVCTSKNHLIPLNVLIDDSEYNNVKFLQISSLWQGKQLFFNIVMP